MHRNRPALCLALALSSFSALACNPDVPDRGGRDDDGDDSAPSPDAGRADGGRDIDAARPDAGKPASDASVDNSDASLAEPDAAVEMDATVADAATEDSDAGKSDASIDAGDAGDAGRDAGRDAAQDAGSDAGQDAGAPDAGQSCEIQLPSFGCGNRVGDDWVHFNNGYDIDTANGRIWSPIVDVTNFSALRTACNNLALGPLDDFEVPEMDDVRTLAAGCDATEADGECGVNSGEVLLDSDDADGCFCNNGIGPKDGLFCRAEVPECVTLWTNTNCGPNFECQPERHWFYDVRSGTIISQAEGQPIANDAKGRCVSAYVGTLP